MNRHEAQKQKQLKA